MKIVSLVGARPQIVKEALVGAAVRQHSAWRHVLVHSGQHYDANMSDVFFQELDIPRPDYHLGVGSGSHAAMTAAALVGMEKVLLKEKPDALLVYGDTNTTLAGALAAAKLHVPVIHVEAGIRMQPKTMPEEINRVLTDRLAALMCCCSALGRDNLAAEGLTAGVTVTGDVMYDLFLRMRPRLTPEATCAAFGVSPDRFVVATLHRDYNVDDPASLRGMLNGLARVQEEHGFTVLLPLHPRTRRRIAEHGLEDAAAMLRTCEPVGYLELMSLTCAAAFVITDSGGLQKEAFYAGKRCAVMMPDTGWRELTACGWNTLCAPEPQSLLHAAASLLAPVAHPGDVYGNGHAAENIIRAIRSKTA
ncbi:non-hydrolyzing UDP-N-acetylglucosamine 2-epimerase [uncultured Desulfovibrio sp.]|uniref:non-hydrolyzing UDP-N-acetylglucosamine 2-epimerase n=1 Tax=uncultured Desulfovibrio sp. TaxID=167968 RepID=UPI0026089D67|nr:UDP-N-acetylglucosamine 2-epimerase (non-hydrolyzing) [uncultured Desulfovibrio sp.]